MADEPEEAYPPCRCGREVRKLNAEQYIVGESGPELFVPSAPGTIIPIKRLSDG